jgi:hypothetical protein
MVDFPDGDVSAVVLATPPPILSKAADRADTVSSHAGLSQFSILFLVILSNGKPFDGFI